MAIKVIGHVRDGGFVSHRISSAVRPRLLTMTSKGLLCQQATGEVTDGVPDGKEADNEDGGEDEQDVFGMYADGIGVDDEVARGGAETYQSVLLLDPAEQQT